MVDTHRVSLKNGEAIVDEEAVLVDERSWSTERWQKIPLDAVTSVKWAKSSSMVLLVLAGWATLGVVGWTVGVFIEQSKTAIIMLSVVTVLATALWIAYWWTRESAVVVSAANAQAKVSSKDPGELKAFAQAIIAHRLAEREAVAAGPRPQLES